MIIRGDTPGFLLYIDYSLESIPYKMVILHSTFIYMLFQCFLYSLLLNLTVEIITNPVLFHARFVLIDPCVESTVESG